MADTRDIFQMFRNSFAVLNGLFLFYGVLWKWVL